MSGGGEEDEGGGHGEPWLVSYADMMTLLFGFFVVMYSFAAAKNEDDGSIVKIRKEIAQFFGGDFVQPYEKAVEEFKQSMGGSVLEQNMTTKLSPEGLEITFMSSALFASGSAEPEPAVRNMLKRIVGIIKERGPESRVIVEGHTDDVPISSELKARFPSNWELGAVRATAVLRLFQEAGFPPDRLAAVSFGESRPLAANLQPDGSPDVANRAKNRRITVKITPIDSSQDGKPSIPAQAL